MKGSLVNRNIIAAAGRSSMRLEPELWAALDDICRREGVRLSNLIPYIEEQQRDGGRTSKVRIFVFSYYRAAGQDLPPQGLSAVVPVRPKLPPIDWVYSRRKPRQGAPKPQRPMMSWQPGVKAPSSATGDRT